MTDTWLQDIADHNARMAYLMGVSKPNHIGFTFEYRGKGISGHESYFLTAPTGETFNYSKIGHATHHLRYGHRPADSCCQFANEHNIRKDYQW